MTTSIGTRKTERKLFDRTSVDDSMPSERARKKKVKREEIKRNEKIKIKCLVVFSCVVFVPFAFFSVPHSGVYLFERCLGFHPCHSTSSFLCKVFARPRRYCAAHKSGIYILENVGMFH